MAIVVSMVVIDISEKNYNSVSHIYGEGLQTGLATFETTVPTWKKWDTGHLPFGRILMMDNHIPVGWAALAPVSSREVYRGVAEVSTYISGKARGKGVGTLLLNKLIEISEANQVWTLQSSIFPENKASHKLHLTCGFREIGCRERIGQLDGVWKDTLLLERRSIKVGL